MNLFKQPLFIALIIMLFSNSIAAKVKIPFGEREVLNKVYDLPNTDEFKLKDGNFMDLATLHKEFNIAYFLPLYIMEEPKIVGYDEKTEAFYDIPQNEIDEIIASQKLKKENLLQLPFYTKYGGKLVAGLIIGLLIWGSIPSKKDKVEPRNV
ncbi:hypothetical protein [Flavobacterium panacagri]|uniref:hypothetical protein n=1 Tax=Flavobacterium panacagri TaxID=3034146 RepID=UPI0025A58222|nr:hypothetical protein [Flavobacterium panacagri]